MACGLSPAIPPATVVLLAAIGLGIDFQGTAIGGTEGAGTVVAATLLVVLGVVSWVVPLRDRLWVSADRPGRALTIAAPIAAAAAAAALFESRSEAWPLGAAIAAAAALVAAYAAGRLLAGARRRLDAQGHAATPLYVLSDGAAIALATLAVIAKPVGALVLFGAIWLAVGSRRRAGGKYAGLRILR